MGARVQLLLAALPGPVRDTLDRFKKSGCRLEATRFLSLAAAVAYLREREEEADDWDNVASGLAEVLRSEQSHAEATAQALAAPPLATAP